MVGSGGVVGVGVGGKALDNKGINKLDEPDMGVTMSPNEFRATAGVGEAVGMNVYGGVGAKLPDVEGSLFPGGAKPLKDRATANETSDRKIRDSTRLFWGDNSIMASQVKKWLMAKV